MNDPIKKLDEFSELILTENKPGKLRAACYDFYDFLCDLVGLNDDFNDSQTYDATILSQGKAVSPLSAARCIGEYKRTLKFIRGVLAAINELKFRFPNETIEILYAGCGPFATLIIPLLRRYSPAELSLTLLDFHEFSIESAQKIFQIFGFENFNAEFIQTDACFYKHPRKLHLVISETMLNALSSETQTAITLNLAPQICENGIFVPQNISVSACFGNPAKEFTEKERYFLGTILELDTENVGTGGQFQNPPVSLKIPNDIKTRNLNLMILTEIQIFDKFKLKDYESSITYPKNIQFFAEVSKVSAVEFKYILDENPHFEHRII
ncbi:MAG TPA: hypothetical protein PKY59_08405 [Pyrinomonadaceae bacterium]|nr:hypothetical protein [Pyrinomonadaceae bacterium]